MSIPLRLLVVFAVLSVAFGDCITLFSVHDAEGCTAVDGFPAGCEAGMQLTLIGLRLNSVTSAYIADPKYPCNITGASDEQLNCTLPMLPPSLISTHARQNVTVAEPVADCAYTWKGGITYRFDESSSSSSSTGSTPTGPVPVIAHVYGCNPNDTASTTTCDGSDNSAAILTILGTNFGNTSFVKLIGQSGTNYSPKNGILTNNDTTITLTTFTLQSADIAQPAMLYVTNAESAQTSAGYSLTFTSAGADDNAEAMILGLKAMTFIIIVVVISLIILLIFTLCLLSLCCGVSLACFNMCCPRQRSSGQVISDSGYTSMS